MRARVVGLTELGAKRRAGWRELEADAVEPNPFYELGPALAAASLLQGGADAAAIVVEDGDELLLALPVLRRQRFRHVPVAALVAWQHPYCFSGVPLVRRGREREAWTEVLDHLRHGGQEHWLVLPRLPLHRPAAVALQDVLADRHAICALDDVFGRPVVRRRPAATYLDGRLSASYRKSLRRRQRRLADVLDGEVLLTDLALALGREVGVERFLSLEASGWKGRHGTAMAQRAGDAEWLRRFCAHLDADGRLQLWALGSVHRPAAMQVRALASGTAFHVKTAYDEAFGSCSPGVQLELGMVEEFHRDSRLALLDSCAESDNRVSALLYPDRDVLATLAVPLRLPLGPVGVAGFAAVARARGAKRRLGRVAR